MTEIRELIDDFPYQYRDRLVAVMNKYGHNRQLMTARIARDLMSEFAKENDEVDKRITAVLNNTTAAVDELSRQLSDLRELIKSRPKNR